MAVAETIFSQMAALTGLSVVIAMMELTWLATHQPKVEPMLAMDTKDGEIIRTCYRCSKTQLYVMFLQKH